MRVTVAHQLARLLGGGVERDRVIDRVLDGERQLGVVAVDRGGAGVDEVAAARVGAGQLQHHQVALDVRVGVVVGGREGVAHAGLGRQVDVVGDVRVGLGDACHRRAVGDVGLDEGEAGVLPQLRQPGLLEAGIVVAVQVVDADDGVATLQQAEAGVEADEAGGAGDEHAHGGGSLRVRPPGLPWTRPRIAPRFGGAAGNECTSRPSPHAAQRRPHARALAAWGMLAFCCPTAPLRR